MSCENCPNLLCGVMDLAGGKSDYFAYCKKGYDVEYDTHKSEFVGNCEEEDDEDN